MKQYLDLLQYVLDNGTIKHDRTGTGTKSIFGYQLRCDLSKGFPLLTTKKVHLKSIIYELLWFQALTIMRRESGVFLIWSIICDIWSMCPPL